MNDMFEDSPDRLYFFKMLLAGKKIEVECRNKYTFLFCRKYLACFEKPDVVVRASENDIKKEVNSMFGPDFYSRNLDEKIATEYVGMETNAILRRIAEALTDYGILLVHGAAVAVHDKCYIFTAPSGTGKSTHINNWMKRIPGTVVINGDKPFVDTVDKIVYGSPWSGKEGWNTNTKAPLAGIIALERGDHNAICKISFRELLPVLLQQTYLPSDPGASPMKGYDLVGRLKNVPCYRLICNMEEESASVAYSGLCKDG